MNHLATSAHAGDTQSPLTTNTTTHAGTNDDEMELACRNEVKHAGKKLGLGERTRSIGTGFFQVPPPLLLNGPAHPQGEREGACYRKKMPK
mmetsp:Transcript_20970/g.41872  ORF Transcript_20970/g.41872 Transcript_20970/m.41872 type:complete len:91 (-) Transcript_20970:402-674(-)